MASGRASRRRGHAVQGRWALVEQAERSHATASDDLGDRAAGQLLARYGVVFRELAARESFTVPWRDVMRALRRREARGVVRGGRFVAGFVGEQYALPDAVDSLRRVRREERTGEVVGLHATDPLNLVGVLTPGPRVPAHQGARLLFRDGAFEGAEPATEPRARRVAPRADVVA
jgi:ATP-dependent Lhr-like helicase